MSYLKPDLEYDCAAIHLAAWQAAQREMAACQELARHGSQSIRPGAYTPPPFAHLLAQALHHVWTAARLERDCEQQRRDRARLSAAEQNMRSLGFELLRACQGLAQPLDPDAIARLKAATQATE
jgi:hypothetical protein